MSRSGQWRAAAGLLLALAVPVAWSQARPAARPELATWAPPGGTVQALAADPSVPGAIELGTTTGVVYRSTDAGVHWHFQARIVPHDDWDVASLVPDPGQPGRWYAGLWSWAQDYSSTGGTGAGGVAVSDDGGDHWTLLLQGHAVRALALAPSDSALLVAAAHDGVYRSRDRGAHWELISPPNNHELANIASVAIDPVNPDEIYVGTWHLPWKTFNGGHDWIQISQGVIDDSDVFSIVVDRAHPATVLLSACSGIYRSDDSGMQFRKVQGIPYSARRTPAIVQDPADVNTVYAGTTEGLWVSRDAGAQWTRVTAPELSVTAVLPLPGHGILLGTEHAGILASHDGGASFTASNDGFVNRHVAAVAASGDQIFESVTGDGRWGGIFVSADRGYSWRQLPPLPAGMESDALAASSAGLVAGAAQGIYQLEGNRWLPRSGKSRLAVYQFAGGGAEAIFAATAEGLYQSGDGGRSWVLMPQAPKPLFRVLRQGDWLYIAGGANRADESFVLRSPDLGRHFIAGALYVKGRINQLTALAPATADGDEPADPNALLVFASTTGGLYRSADSGANWALSGHGMGQQNMRGVYKRGGDLIASGAAVGVLFQSADGGRSWRPLALAAAEADWANNLAVQLAPGSAAAPAAPVPFAGQSSTIPRRGH